MTNKSKIKSFLINSIMFVGVAFVGVAAGKKVPDVIAYINKIGQGELTNKYSINMKGRLYYLVEIHVHFAKRVRNF